MIAIIGGGLSGSYMAYLLENAGNTNYTLFEARSSLGGRAYSPELTWKFKDQNVDMDKVDRFDLGAAWFWPTMQPQLARLVGKLGLKTFEQHETGDIIMERANQPLARFKQHGDNGWVRVQGGMTSIINACTRTIDPARIKLSEEVYHVQATDSTSPITISTRNAQGTGNTYQFDQVFFALPPRLAAQTIRFQPELPKSTLHEWSTTDTWMANAAKYVAVYDQPFWRKDGLSGDAFSRIGPLGEIHDASSHMGSSALFGFFAIDAKSRRSMGEDKLLRACREQLARVFGDKALAIKTDVIRDWSAEKFTATEDDCTTSRGHSSTSPEVTPSDGIWRGKIIGIGSEWSTQFPGFIAGAIDAADQGSKHVGVNDERGSCI